MNFVAWFENKVANLQIGISLYNIGWMVLPLRAGFSRHVTSDKTYL